MLGNQELILPSLPRSVSFLPSSCSKAFWSNSPIRWQLNITSRQEREETRRSRTFKHWVAVYFGGLKRLEQQQTCLTNELAQLSLRLYQFSTMDVQSKTLMVLYTGGLLKRTGLLSIAKGTKGSTLEVRTGLLHGCQVHLTWVEPMGRLWKPRRTNQGA